MDFLGAGRFVDPLAMLVVIGGSLLIAALRSSREDIARAGAALGPLLRARPEEEARIAMSAVRAIERVAQLRTIASADRVATAGEFVHRASLRLADARSRQAFALWAQEDIDDRQARHAAAAAVWRALADTAPAMGMAGTVIGLVRMFAAMDDTAALGPAMALAMLTTLYGVLLGSAFAGPIAARLERLSAVEIAWQRAAARRLEHLAEVELAAPAPARLRPVA